MHSTLITRNDLVAFFRSGSRVPSLLALLPLFLSLCIRHAALAMLRACRVDCGAAGHVAAAGHEAQLWLQDFLSCYRGPQSDKPHTFSAVLVTSQIFGGLLLSHTTTINYGALSEYITTERVCLSLIRYHTPQ
jgi:hypothetical protein